MITDQSIEPSEPAGTEQADGSQEVLSHDKVFHLLQNERRRRVIRYLHDVEGKTDMRDIAEKVAAWEHDKTVRTLSSEERQRVYIPLYQNHLPKLDEEGIIDYNQSRGTVERNPLADQLETHLFERADERPPEASAPATDAQQQQQQSQYSYSLVASGIASILLITAALGLPILSSPPDLLFGTLILLVFLGAELLRQRPLR